LSLILDNSGGGSDSGTCTPFPADLNGVQLIQLSISRTTCVDVRQSAKNNDVRAYRLDLDGSSKVTGDSISIDTSSANVRGQITGTSVMLIHNTQSGAGVVTAYSGSSMTCSSCPQEPLLSTSTGAEQRPVVLGVGSMQLPFA
jgi:hypothetical protein